MTSRACRTHHQPSAPPEPRALPLLAAPVNERAAGTAVGAAAAYVSGHDKYNFFFLVKKN